MFLLNNEKFNPYIQHTIGDTQYPPRWFLDPAERKKIGIVEAVEVPIPDYNPITHQVREAPFAQVNGVLTQQWELVALDSATVSANQARAAAQAREAAKQARTAAIAAITVTTSTGKVFDGDEAALRNLTTAHAIGTANNITTTMWTLADNTRVEVTLAEITEAMTLSGLAQSALWGL